MSYGSHRVVLVTGVSSGIGRAIANHLAQKGYNVFGTIRKPLAQPPDADMVILPLDVRLDESVEACVQQVIERAGSIDVLINNAGYVLAGALEEATIAQAKMQFETNVFGVMRMVRAVLPHMREQESGQIINISSVAGRIPVIFWGMYTASKFALEGYTETLMYEVRPFNIRVSLVEPHFIRTSLADNAQYGEERIMDYAFWRARGLDAIEFYESRAPGPEVVAACVGRILEQKNPALRYPVGKHAGLMTWARGALPDRMAAWIIRRYFQIHEKKPGTGRVIP